MFSRVYFKFVSSLPTQSTSFCIFYWKTSWPKAVEDLLKLFENALQMSLRLQANQLVFGPKSKCQIILKTIILNCVDCAYYLSSTDQTFSNKQNEEVFLFINSISKTKARKFWPPFQLTPGANALTYKSL